MRRPRNFGWTAWTVVSFLTATMAAAQTAGRQQAGAQAAPPATASDLDYAGAQAANLDADLALARFCEQRGEPAEAEKLYMVYLAKHPETEHSLPYHRLGVLCARQGKFDQARGHFLRAVARTPNDVQLLADFGYFWYLDHQLEEAESVLVRAMRLAPNEPQVTEKLALVLGVQGRYADSLDLFRRTLTDAEAYSNLAYVYSINGDLSRAKAAYRHALTLDNTLRRSAQAAVAITERERLVRSWSGPSGVAARPAPVLRSGEENRNAPPAAVRVVAEASPPRRATPAPVRGADYTRRQPTQAAVEPLSTPARWPSVSPRPVEAARSAPRDVRPGAPVRLPAVSDAIPSGLTEPGRSSEPRRSSPPSSTRGGRPLFAPPRL